MSGGRQPLTDMSEWDMLHISAVCEVPAMLDAPALHAKPYSLMKQKVVTSFASQ